MFLSVRQYNFFGYIIFSRSQIFSIKGGVIRFNCGALVTMKFVELKANNFYTLERNTLIGGLRVKVKNKINNQECAKQYLRKS